MNTPLPSQYVNTPQAAAALGVSVSTVKRWVDEGVLPAHRTAGGHRKLLRAEVLALARQGELTQGDLGALSGVTTKKKSPTDLPAAADSLASTLLDGDAAAASALIRRLYASGIAVEALADRVIAPALATVGHDWQTGKIDVWQEHRGTQICAAALYDLRNDLTARAEKNRPIAVGGAPEGDPYVLPSLLSQYTLLDAGWDAINLGPNTPLASVQKAIHELKPRLVWISVSYLADAAAFVAAYKALYRQAERLGIPVAIGGRALTEPIRASIPYTTHGDGLAHLTAFARALHPRQKPPRRGRPKKGP
jgi:excisionase family DNA binding protein